MDSNKNIGIGGALVIAIVAGLLAGGLAAWLVKPKVASIPSDGLIAAAPGNLLAEDYDPYVQYNGGYNSAKSITTSDTVTAADGAFTDDVTITDDLAVTGLATIGETLSVTGAATFSSTIAASATSTLATTTLRAANLFAVGSTTPEHGTSEQIIDGAGTTTLKMGSSSATKGSCFEIETSNGTIARVYATSSTPSLLVVEAGRCK